jgi:branched-chain amino acid transport system substrate-binding protein
VKIGYITPITGPLAAFGEGDQYVVDQMTAWFKDHPIQAGGKSYGVDIVMKDSQSDPKRAGELAAELINTDGVDILMAHATPETTVPVAAQCEANATPCITADTPWQPWVAGLGANPGDPKTALKWSYHFFWGLEDMAAVYMDMWNQIDTNKKVAALYPNDADGQAFTDTAHGFPAIIGPAGFTFDNPGLYPSGTQDFSSQISAFKKNDDQILTGIVPPPDFINFWKQAKQQGYNPKIATIGKAIEFPAAVAALGDLAQNLGTEVWWAPSYPTTSSLTGVSSADFAKAYTDSTGKQWNVTLGFSESLFETAAAAVVAAGGKDKQKIADAMKTMKVNALVGPLDWNTGPFPNVAKTYLTGAQWRKTDGGPFPYELVIVSNAHAKEMGLDVPTAGKVEPLP